MEHAITSFQIPVEDMDRAVTFYSTILDYDFQAMEMGDATLAFWPSGKDIVSGGLIKHHSISPCPSGTLIYLNAGKDLGVVLDKVDGAGGSIEIPKTSLGEGMGFFAIFRDTEGNRVGLNSPN